MKYAFISAVVVVIIIFVLYLKERKGAIYRKTVPLCILAIIGKELNNNVKVNITENRTLSTH